MKRARLTKCKVCREPFQKRSMTHKACSSACALALIEQDKKKAALKDLKARRLAIKSRSEWLKEAQAVFNRYIRLRDDKQPCISCGRHHEGQFHAGHYLSTGARPELRFDERNVHKQCQPCNTHLHGNLLLYRKALVARYGLAFVEALEADHAPKKYTIDDLIQIKSTYSAKVKELKNGAS